MGQNKVRDIMTTDLVTLSPNNTVRDATIRLAVENISGAPVVDENYRMVGILSGNDILELIMKYDRKIVFIADSGILRFNCFSGRCNNN